MSGYSSAAHSGTGSHPTPAASGPIITSGSPGLGTSVRGHPPTLFILGAISLFAGLCALFFPFAAAFATNVVVGVALMTTGLVTLGHAFRVRGARGWVGDALAGVLALGVGFVMLAFPLSGVLTLGLLMIVYFVGQGILRTALALQHRGESGWGWLLASALLEIALGVLVASGYPGTAIWMLGVMLGLDLLFSGFGLIMVGSAVRRAQNNPGGVL